MGCNIDETSLEKCKSCGQRMTLLSAGNSLGFVIIKIFVAVISDSKALLADAIYTASCLISVLSSYWEKTPDDKKTEKIDITKNVVGFVAALILSVAAISVIFASGKVLFSNFPLDPPKLLAFWIALLAVYSNFVVAYYTNCAAKNLDSATLKSIATDNRFGAYWSIPVVICVLGSQWGLPQLDPIAAIVVAIAILKNGVQSMISNYKGYYNYLLETGSVGINGDPAKKKAFAAQLSVVSNSILVVGKFISGFLTGSISIISEAIHSSLDLVAALIANFSVRKASEPPDEEHRFGHGKYENVSALIEGAIIFFAAYLILNGALDKLLNGVHLEVLDFGIAIMFIATVANILISQYLFKIAKETDSDALLADAWHLRTDVYTSAGVFLGLFVIRIINRPGVEIIDPIIAMITALIIVKAAWDLCRDAIYNLLDAKLPAEEENKIIDLIKNNTQQYVGFRKLRTRKAGSGRHVELCMVVPSSLNVDDANSLVNHIKQVIENDIGNIDTVISIHPCKKSCADCFIKCAEMPNNEEPQKQEGTESVVSNAT